ncbi:MAG: sulfurtransferase TusA family protein [Paludibacteraceae bacterium]|nr:sulfurtransferase TusA family protein [Paludibacteraceae bacterium]
MKHELDITREHCPMTFVKTKLALANLGAGEMLEVLVSEGEPLRNIPRSATEQGFTVISVEPVADGIHRITIQK